MAKGQKRKRRLPQRTCVACRQAQHKRDLVRIVRPAAGEVHIDPTGKHPGRGAYLCRKRECWELALAERRLDHALNIKLSNAEQVRLAEFAQTLSEVSDHTPEEPYGSEGE
jgi:predicted RNA-binding protein YlxR (DUF448 family)